MNSITDNIPSTRVDLDDEKGSPSLLPKSDPIYSSAPPSERLKTVANSVFEQMEVLIIYSNELTRLSQQESSDPEKVRQTAEKLQSVNIKLGSILGQFLTFDRAPASPAPLSENDTNSTKTNLQDMMSGLINEDERYIAGIIKSGAFDVNGSYEYAPVLKQGFFDLSKSNKLTPLYAVALNGCKVSTLDLLVENGAHIEDDLMEAAILGKNQDNFKWCLDKCKNLDHVGKTGFTPLQLAILINSSEHAELLLKNGADVNKTEKTFNNLTTLTALGIYETISKNINFKKNFYSTRGHSIIVGKLDRKIFDLLKTYNAKQ